MIELRGVTFSYGKRTILRDLSFTAQPGECVVLAGPNGSGKSTALSIIAGVLRPTQGEIITQGTIGYAPQGTALFEDMSVADNLRFFADLAHCTVPRHLPFSLDQHRKIKVSKLSGGMKKQVSIACTLLGDPSLILLDEPCAALDVEYRSELITLIHQLKEQGKTIIYASHEPMEFASFYDKLVFLGEHAVCCSRDQLSGAPANTDQLCKQFSLLFRENKR